MRGLMLVCACVCACACAWARRWEQDFLEVARFLRGRPFTVTAGAPTDGNSFGLPWGGYRAVAAEGRSAGGYLVGAALNADPALFAAALLEVRLTSPLPPLSLSLMRCEQFCKQTKECCDVSQERLRGVDFRVRVACV